jgi:NADH-quinone oxidoreductase subunit L
MTQMGGLRKKMPITAYTMLIGVIAISGLAIPGTEYLFGHRWAFSGYHSKDAILAGAMTFTKLNGHPFLFLVPLFGAGMTAFYMFRMWFYTFAGKPRDLHVYDHAHESPAVMVLPLIVLSFFAAFCAVGGEDGPLYGLIGHSEPVGLAQGNESVGLTHVKMPGHHAVHENHAAAGTYALIVAGLGLLVAILFYGLQLADPAAVQRYFSKPYGFLVNKWAFDDLYDAAFVRPVHIVAGWCTAFDRVVIDGILHGSTRAALDVSRWDRKFDETIVDGLVNLLANVTYTVARSFRVAQTGLLRNYVMFIALGVLGLFVLMIACFPSL